MPITPIHALPLLWGNSPIRAQTAILLRFLEHTQLDTHSVALQRTREQFLAEADIDITHNKLKRRRSMPSAGFEPVIPEIEQPHVYVLYCSRPLYDRRICSIRGTYMQIRNTNH